MKEAFSTLFSSSILAAGVALVSSLTALPTLAAPKAAEKQPVVQQPAVQVLNVTGQGASGFVNGAIFQQVSDGVPAGTGNINSFLRLQSPGNSTNEQGYNTDARPLQFDENNSPQFTRSLLLGDVPIVNIGGTDYRQFILDLNEPNNEKQGDPLITLSQLQIFLGNAPNLTGYPSFGGNATQIFDLDAGSDNSVLLNDRNSGSGRYDYTISIQNSFFTGSNPYVYLFSQFTGAEGGFEEFAVRTAQTQTPPSQSVPEPATLAGLGLVAGATVVSRRRQIRKSA